jgi:hypothetical protein
MLSLQSLAIMNQPGTLLYKCRRCGDIDRSLHSPNITMSVIIAMARIKDPTREPVKEWITHICPDGSLGVCDLIGAELDNVES